ncbi:MAG: exodeoxyribonuclease III [Nevskia sp.]
MRIATWNVNSLRVRLPQVLDWLAANPVDALALQETKLTDEAFPAAEFEAAGWHWVHSGQKTYNGVAILSRHPLSDVQRDLPGFADEQKRVIAATVHAPGGAFRFVDVYVVNGQAVGSEKYAYKLRFLAALRDYIQSELAQHPRLAVGGDYNIAPALEDTHDPAFWEGNILCSEAERDGFRALLGLGLADAFRLLPQEPGSYTWWDYRAAGFRRNLGLRIDHLLLSAELARGCSACRVDLVPRRNERPSDHAPLVAEIA